MSKGFRLKVFVMALFWSHLISLYYTTGVLFGMITKPLVVLFTNAYLLPAVVYCLMICIAVATNLLELNLRSPPLRD